LWHAPIEPDQTRSRPSKHTRKRTCRQHWTLASLIVLARLSGLTESDEAIADLLHDPEYDAIIDDFLTRHGVEKDASDDEVNPAVSPIVKSAKRDG
jgi:hypothetical protein